MNDFKANCDWRKDLTGFRGLTTKEKDAFLLVLEWFESFRSRLGLEADRDAVDAFWQTEVVPEDRPRESRHLEQWKGAMDWYLNWLSACAMEEVVDDNSLAAHVRAAVKVASGKLGMARPTTKCYSVWVARYADFAGSKSEMVQKATAIRFIEFVVKDSKYGYPTRKQALNSVQFFLKHVCGLEDADFYVKLK